MNKAAQVHTANKRDTIVNTTDVEDVQNSLSNSRQKVQNEVDEMNNANRR